MSRIAPSRRLAALFLAATVLAPVAWTAATWADDWADLTSPTDNPDTPGPDLYNNKRYEDGVQSMPDLVATQLAPLAEALPLPVEDGSTPEIAVRPANAPLLRSSACRGPPAFLTA